MTKSITIISFLLLYSFVAGTAQGQQDMPPITNYIQEKEYRASSVSIGNEPQPFTAQDTEQAQGGRLSTNMKGGRDTALFTAPGETIFLETERPCNGAGCYWTQGFTISGTTKFALRFAADFKADAAVITPDQLSNFTGNGAFTGYGVFDDRFGTKYIQLAAGTYYLAIRTQVSSANVLSVELDYQLTDVPGYHFYDNLEESKYVAANGGYLYQPITIDSGVRYFVDGCNSGVETYVIPESQLNNFINRLSFTYYTTFSGTSTNLPGYYELNLPLGKYYLAFRNTSNINKAVVYSIERWTNLNIIVEPPNPIDGTDFFVRQHYVDFLNRPADASGLTFWTNNVEQCGTNASCREAMRINTSAAFFLSIEFKETGFLVYRMYKVAFGNLSGKPVPVVRSVFITDTQTVSSSPTQVIVGQTGWQQQLETNKQSFASTFVQRAAFQADYPPTMSALEFVNKLNSNAGGVLSSTERTTLTNGLSTGMLSRAQVLRQVAENGALQAAEINRAFVLTQYFGYLQRDPDGAPDFNFDGYNFWLTKLNQFGGDYNAAEMVKAFVSSLEYRRRFGQ